MVYNVFTMLLNSVYWAFIENDINIFEEYNFIFKIENYFGSFFLFYFLFLSFNSP